MHQKAGRNHTNGSVQDGLYSTPIPPSPRAPTPSAGATTMKRKTKRLLPLCSLLLANPHSTYAQPESLHPDVRIRLFKVVRSQAIRIAYNSADGLLYYLKIPGSIFALDPVTAQCEQVASADDHGITVAVGFAIGADGTFFVVAIPRTARTMSASSCAAS